MTHRPYPNADRARHQLARHDNEAGPYRAPRPMTPMERTLVEFARTAVRAAAPTLAAMTAAFQRPAGSEEKTT